MHICLDPLLSPCFADERLSAGADGQGVRNYEPEVAGGRMSAAEPVAFEQSGVARRGLVCVQPMV